MPGSIGKVVDVNTTASFTSATISIPYNESDLHGVSENDLKISMRANILSSSSMYRALTLLTMWSGAKLTTSQPMVSCPIHHT